MTLSLPTFHSDARVWQAGHEVVQRTIRAEWEVIRARLTDPHALRAVPMRFDQDFERVDRLIEIWRAAGRIERHGRLERIEIEVTQASHISAELRVLPWTQRLHHWNRKRQDWLVEVADHVETALTGRMITTDIVLP